MKIAYILNSTDPLGGATKAFMSYLNSIIHLGVTPLVVVPDHNGIYNKLQESGITTCVLNYRPQTYPKWKTAKDFVMFLPRMVGRVMVNHIATYRLVTILKDFHPDLIHTNVSVINIGYMAARKMKLPHIYHIREYGDKDFDLHYFPCKEVFLSQLSGAQSFNVCITNDIQKHHQQHQNPHSKVIYDSICQQIQSMPFIEQKDYFLYAGRIQHTKGLDLLLEAYRDYIQASASKTKLYVAGDFAESKYCQQMVDFVAQNHLQPYVSFLGARSDINTLMQQAKAIIIPSRHEGFGLCMPEAMFCGCLAVAHNTAGSKEQLDNGLELEKAEIALRYNTPAELCQQLLKIDTMTKEEISLYTERAFHAVNKLYTTEVCSKKLFDYYQSIIYDTL